MAKKKKRKSLLPKRIAGVRVPKSVRKGRLGELLASQTGQALLAEAVLAAGGIAGAKKAGDVAADKVGGGGGLQRLAEGMATRLKENSGKGGAASGAALAIAFGEAARAFVKALDEQHQRHEPPAAAEPDWQADGEGSKKKPDPSDSLPH